MNPGTRRIRVGAWHGVCTAARWVDRLKCRTSDASGAAAHLTLDPSRSPAPRPPLQLLAISQCGSARCEVRPSYCAICRAPSECCHRVIP
eukprot:scaffold27196_cov111-Isochrysis_galbana.AAC.5